MRQLVDIIASISLEDKPVKAVIGKSTIGLRVPIVTGPFANGEKKASTFRVRPIFSDNFIMAEYISSGNTSS
jgi:hypothetical protein